MRLCCLTALFTLCFALSPSAQPDSARTIPLVAIHFSGQVPFQDMAERFGPNLNAGGAFMLKHRSNWVVGIESNYFFGRNVKEDVLSNLTNEDGFVVDNEGYPADLRVSERGFGVHLFGGKVLPLLSANANSGLLVTIGAGYLQHQVKLYDSQQRVAAVAGELRRGYDRLTGGFSATQFIGYLFLGKRRLINLYFGFEFYEASTRSFRKINYNTGTADTRERLDVLCGFRAGWILPLYKKKPDDFYYY
jgi:hypothetical protein